MPEYQFPKSINKPIRDELYRRESISGDVDFGSSINRDGMVWQHGKVSWARLMSNVEEWKSGDVSEISVDGHLPENVLYGGGLTNDGKLRGGFEEEYTVNNRPKAGITGISVETKGTYGSLKTASISFVVYDIQELEKFETLFMTPGMTCTLEWGWSVSTQGQSTIPELSNLDKIKELFSKAGSPEAESPYTQLINNSYGCYDIMVGYVKNFSWSMTEEGSFTCTTEIVSTGQTAMQSMIRGETVNPDYESEDDGEDKPKTLDEFAEHIEDEFERLISRGATKVKGGFGDWGSRVTDRAFKDKRGSNRNYITIAAFEEIVNNFVERKTDSMDSVSRFESAGVEILNHPKLMSADPSICILVGQPRKDIPRLANFAKPNDPHAGFLHNILIEIDFIKDSIENSDTIMDLYKTILTKVNDSCFNLWNFKFITPDDKPSVINIIDENYSSSWPTQEDDRNFNIHEFKLYSIDSVIRSFSMSTKIPSTLSLQIMQAAHKPSGSKQVSQYMVGADSLWRSIDDKLLQGIRSANCDTAQDSVANSDKNTETAKSKHKEILDGISNDPKSWYNKKLDASERNAIRSVLFSPIEAELKNSKLLNNRVLPLELDITIDGISGIYYGDTFMVDFLPERYIGNVYFVVIGVSNEISISDWTTTIKGQIRISPDV